MIAKTRFAGVITWVVILLTNIGIIGWLAVGKGVTSLQSQYATLSGPGIVAKYVSAEFTVVVPGRLSTTFKSLP